MRRIKVGILGCGYISDDYLRNFTQAYTNNVEVTALCDIIPERAQKQAKRYGIPKAYERYEDMLASDDVELILNLTNPAAHMETSVSAIGAGKHVYIEKPFVMYRSDAKELIGLAQRKGVRIGCAPDTFLASGTYTTRTVLNSGLIGKPFAAFGGFCHRVQDWHKNPSVFFQPGAGPLYDGIPYYIATWVNIFGPVTSVSASLSAPFPSIKPVYGPEFEVEVPTLDIATLTFQSGVVASMLYSFNFIDSNMPRFEIFGSEGTMNAHLPNAYSASQLGETIRIKRAGDSEWRSIPEMTNYRTFGHGLGLAEMCSSIAQNRRHRCNEELGYHVLDVMNAFEDSSREGRVWKIESTFVQMDPLPADLLFGELD